MEKGHGLWGPRWSLCGAAAGPGNIAGRGGPCLSQASSYPTPWPGAGPGALVTAPLPPSCPPVPSAPPRKVEAEALNATAIRVLWRSPTPGRQHGQIRGYQVHYVRMEGAEARGPPRIKDIMLADAQVGRHGWGGRVPGHCLLSAPHSTAGSPLTSLLSLPPPPPAQWEMDDTAEYVSSFLGHPAVLAVHSACLWSPGLPTCVPACPP